MHDKAMDLRPKQRWIVLLGTSSRTLGGIAAAIRSYESAGLFASWPVIHIATHADGSRVKKVFIASRGLFQFIALLVRGRILLAHVHSASDASFWRKSLFIGMAYAAGKPVIFHLHGGGFSDFYRHRCGPIRRWLVRFILDRAAQIVVLSDVWCKRIRAITRNPNVCAIANLVEAGALLAINPSHRPCNTILFMGRLDKQKGILDLVDALALLRSRHPELRLRFAGDGDVESVRQRAIECNVLDAIEFVGWVSGAAKIRAWSEASLYVLPSYIENLPMGVLEAMAAGIPVVASDVGGIPDVVVHDVNGLLHTPGDVVALAAAIHRLAADSSLRARFGKASRERFRNLYASERIVPMLEAVYVRLGARPQKVSARAASDSRSSVEVKKPASSRG